MAIGKVIEGTYGVVAEFHDSDELVRAASAAREEGYTQMDAYSPFPVHGLHEAVGMETTRLPLVVLTGGIIGGLSGFFMCWYANVISYPLNIGGRPYNSWPAWIPINAITRARATCAATIIASDLLATSSSAAGGPTQAMTTTTDVRSRLSLLMRYPPTPSVATRAAQ